MMHRQPRTPPTRPPASAVSTPTEEPTRRRACSRACCTPRPLTVASPARQPRSFGQLIQRDAAARRNGAAPAGCPRRVSTAPASRRRDRHRADEERRGAGARDRRSGERREGEGGHLRAGEDGTLKVHGGHSETAVIVEADWAVCVHVRELNFDGVVRELRAARDVADSSTP
eukprot:609990-Rhodomonas_salina.1